LSDLETLLEAHEWGRRFVDDAVAAGLTEGEVLAR
jgi:hypothetical protein